MDVTSDDPESVDASSDAVSGSGEPTTVGPSATPSGFDLSPRNVESSAHNASTWRRLTPWLGALVVLGGIGVTIKSLAGATTYFYNVDQAVEKRSEFGDRRIRIQGNVVKGSIDQTSADITFTLKYNGATVPVTLTDDPPDLFGPAIPVVLEGKFAGSRFMSDKALVKHDENYEEKNSSRVIQAEKDAKKNASDQSTSSDQNP